MHMDNPENRLQARIERGSNDHLREMIFARIEELTRNTPLEDLVDPLSHEQIVNFIKSNGETLTGDSQLVALYAELSRRYNTPDHSQDSLIATVFLGMGAALVGYSTFFPVGTGVRESLYILSAGTSLVGFVHVYLIFRELRKREKTKKE